MREELGL